MNDQRGRRLAWKKRLEEEVSGRNYGGEALLDCADGNAGAGAGA
jgi:hypothetical protein